MDNDELLDLPDFLNHLPPDETDKPDDAVERPAPDPIPALATDDIEGSEMHPHPYADMFPMMCGEEFRALVASIKVDGLDEHITTFEGTILDGRNRHAACIEAGVDPLFTEHDGGDLLGFVLRKNLHRRHLLVSQRAMIAARMANLGSGQHASQKCEAVTLNQAAETLNVSPRSVDNAKSLLASGHDELIKNVERGKVTVSAAAKQITQAAKPAVPPVSDGVTESKRLLKLWAKTGEEGKKLFVKAIHAETSSLSRSDEDE